MRKIVQVLAVALSAGPFFSGCGQPYFGKLPPSNAKAWDRWSKDGQTREQKRQQYETCLVSENNAQTMEAFAEVDRCMLRAGFVFVDDPIRPHCDAGLFPDLAKLPSCQSLKRPN